MGQITEPKPVKLILSILARNSAGLEHIRSLLIQEFGPEEETMDPIPFTWTNYYADELGAAPMKFLVSYEKLIKREQLVNIKLQTNDIEQKLSESKLRTVNLDPGYMTLGQFFLATTKDQRHRVYVGQGIFMETTLYFNQGNFKPFDWTYRDYQSPEYIKFFLAARSKFVYQLKHGHPYSQRK